MRAFFAEKNAIKGDKIAARQLHALRGYNPLSAKKLRLSDVHEMFAQMRDHGRSRRPGRDPVQIVVSMMPCGTGERHRVTGVGEAPCAHQPPPSRRDNPTPDRLFLRSIPQPC
jgi:hypothetical protein